MNKEVEDIAKAFYSGKMTKTLANYKIRNMGIRDGNERCCQSGYEWLPHDDSSPMYRIDRCTGGAHMRIVLKNPPLRKKKKGRKKTKLIKTLDGNLVPERQKNHEDNILE